MTSPRMTLQMSVRVDEYQLHHENKAYVLTHYVAHSASEHMDMKAGDQTVAVSDDTGKLFSLTTEKANRYPLTLFGGEQAEHNETLPSTFYALIENSVDLMAKRDQALRYPTIYVNPAMRRRQPALYQAMKTFVAAKPEREKKHTQEIKKEWKKKNAANGPA